MGGEEVTDQIWIVKIVARSHIGLLCQNFQKADLLGWSFKRCKGTFSSEKWRALVFSFHCFQKSEL